MIQTHIVFVPYMGSGSLTDSSGVDIYTYNGDSIQDCFAYHRTEGLIVISLQDLKLLIKEGIIRGDKKSISALLKLFKEKNYVSINENLSSLDLEINFKKALDKFYLVRNILDPTLLASSSDFPEFILDAGELLEDRFLLGVCEDFAIVSYHKENSGSEELNQRELVGMFHNLYFSYLNREKALEFRGYVEQIIGNILKLDFQDILGLVSTSGMAQKTLEDLNYAGLKCLHFEFTNPSETLKKVNSILDININYFSDLDDYFPNWRFLTHTSHQKSFKILNVTEDLDIHIDLTWPTIDMEDSDINQYCTSLMYSCILKAFNIITDEVLSSFPDPNYARNFKCSLVKMKVNLNSGELSFDSKIKIGNN